MAYDKAEAQAAESERAALRLRGVDAALRFADTFPQHAETPAVLTRATRVLFDAGDRARAEAVAQRVLALGSRADPAQQLVAWTVLAHTYFDDARYADAERAYAELVARLPAGDPQRAEATERLAASVYRQAEAQQAAGDVNGAVQQFLRVASVAPDSPSGAKAEYDAAALLINAGQWNEAAAVLERFRSAHPGHELEPQVTRKLAAAYLEAGRQHDAAVELERVSANTAEDAEVRRAVLWQAAELYVATDDPASARRAYAAYVERFPTPVEPAIEARQELADLAAAAGDPASRKRWLEELVVAADAAGSERSRVLAARASLELARPLDQLARSIRLAIPLDRSLAAKKSAMEASLSAYARAAGYGFAEVTTAADFAMADLYRDLGACAARVRAPGRPVGRGAGAVRPAARGAGLSIRGEGHRHPRAQRQPRAGRDLRSVGARLLRRARRDEACTLRSQRDAGRPGSDRGVRRRSRAGARRGKGCARRRRHARQRRVMRRRRLPSIRPMPRASTSSAWPSAGSVTSARHAQRTNARSRPTRPSQRRNAISVCCSTSISATRPARCRITRRTSSSPSGADPDVGPWLVELRTRLGQVQRTAEAQP